jgi:phenylalanine-4-hydroxylase
MRTHYRIDDFQECYFVLDSLDDLLALARIDFDPIYERLNSGPTYAPGDVLPADRMFHYGDGNYARSRMPSLA